MSLWDYSKDSSLVTLLTDLQPSYRHEISHGITEGCVDVLRRNISDYRSNDAE